MRFGDFKYEPDQRRLTKSGEPVDLSGRYLDALGLMLAEPGSLVTKDRFMDEVWRGVPVTDEALTQAIRALRKALGDDAANPRFIETVPKHGYRFIAPVEVARTQQTIRSPLLPFVLAGASGGAVAGGLGGFAFGLAGGGASILVLIALTALLGMIGGVGVALGIAVIRALGQQSLVGDMMGGALGGLIVGALARVMGIDAFTLFFGAAPTAMTGAFEGLLLGAGAGLAIGLRPARRRSAIGLGAAFGGTAGLFISLLGGRLMAGSLALLDATVPNAAVKLEWLVHFQAVSSDAALVVPTVTALEGATFVGLLTLSLFATGSSQPEA